jgi:hypothetical protein
MKSLNNNQKRNYIIPIGTLIDSRIVISNIKQYITDNYNYNVRNITNHSTFYLYQLRNLIWSNIYEINL